MSSANKLVDRKVHFFLLLRNKKYAKKVPSNLSSWEKPRKLDAAKINTFTVVKIGEDQLMEENLSFNNNYMI